MEHFRFKRTTNTSFGEHAVEETFQPNTPPTPSSEASSPASSCPSSPWQTLSYTLPADKAQRVEELMKALEKVKQLRKDLAFDPNSARTEDIKAVLGVDFTTMTSSSASLYYYKQQQQMHSPTQSKSTSCVSRDGWMSSIEETRKLDDSSICLKRFRSDDSSEDPDDQPTKRHRRKKSLEQMKLLRNYFSVNPKPGKIAMRAIAQNTNLAVMDVSRWFRNERHKTKKDLKKTQEMEAAAQHMNIMTIADNSFATAVPCY